MKETKKKLLDIINLKLFGKILIEASAGTGKTFSIIILYLRLLLGITHDKNNKKKLLSKEILIVTFAEHSKNEIKYRIKKYIYKFKIMCINRKSNLKPFQKLITKIDNFKTAIDILSNAEHHIDELSIYTIHGFCYHALNISGLSSNILNQNKIIKNEYELYLKSSDQFWKQYFLFLPKQISKIILKYCNNPQSLLKIIFPILKNIQPNKKLLKNKETTIIQSYYEFINLISIFKKQWLMYKNCVYITIIHSNINKRSYNKTNLTRWINKIDQWALKNTDNFSIPKELTYFKQSYLIDKTISGNPPICKIFKAIDTFLNINFSLEKQFFKDAIIEIINLFQQTKKKKKYFEYDDLINFLSELLKVNHKNVASTIKKKYPVALIDEFQDTNIKQYNIFKKIYYKKDNLLILIGDPKQAIYNFRGADISAYLKAKVSINNLYYLNTNWRSSYNMTKSINLLFSKIDNPFIFKNIDFTLIKTPNINKKLRFEINQKNQPALKFLSKKELINITSENYLTSMAYIFSKYIAYLIKHGEQGNAIIYTTNQTKIITANDISIIVKNVNEAKIIITALNKLEIPTIYLSNRKSVFHSKEALEILWLLKAIINPHNEVRLKQAMSTNILSKDSKEIFNLTNNHTYWSKLINEFNTYLKIWNKYGILNMIYKILFNYKIFYDNSAIKNNVNITNIIHIGELLEKKYIKLYNKNTLIFWFEEKISKNFEILKSEKIRSKYNKHYIKVMTVHKSKGLEYPITIIPFAMTFFENFNKSYTNKIFSILSLNNESSTDHLTVERKEVLSENIRLLYVALTRSILQCYIGITSIKEKILNHNYTDIYNNTLNYFKQSKQKKKSNNIHPCSSYLLSDTQKYKKTAVKPLSLYPFNTNKLNLYSYSSYTINKSLFNYTINEKFNNNPTIISYSKLKKTILIPETLKNINRKNILNDYEIKNKETKTSKKVQLTYHTFPKGKKYGIFIHKILNTIVFNQKINIIWLSQQLIKHNLEIQWLKIIKNWIYHLINFPFIKSSNCTLSKLTPKNYIKEFEFHFLIKKKITKSKFKKIFSILKIKKHTFFNLNNKKISGIFNGFIDLVFHWENKYFIVDYKSNWLGNSNFDYSKKNLHDTIQKNYYDFQCTIYILALHKYLKQKIKNYNFNIHFGGAYILFLRAINPLNFNTEIYHILPSLNVITQLDKIF